MWWFGRAALVLVLILTARGEAPPLVRILASELDRNFKVLREKGDPPPYYISYEVFEIDGASAVASLGALKSLRANRARFLDVTVRVGSPNLDNYHRIPGERVRFTGGISLPIEDSEAAIRRRVWLETDRVYRAAAERLIKIRTNREVKVAEEDDSDDFSKQEPPAPHFEAPPRVEFPADDAAARVRKWSAEFTGFPAAVTSQAALSAGREIRYLVDTEGARLQHGRANASISLSASAKAGDGMDLVLSQTLDAGHIDRLPRDREVAAAAERIGRDLTALLGAPVMEPFVGPAILSGRASAVLFHEIFGHRIEGHRQKDEAEGQTFTRSIGEKVLPEFLSVIADPTRRDSDGEHLNGHYLYDDEGVPARPVTVVEKGVLKAFLMSRSPVRGFASSNGHGRRQPGYEVVARQSNLFVESAVQVPEAKLREMLLAEVRRQNKPYGLYFREVTGGFTTTRRRGVQAFKVAPVLVYRVYPDGRPDQLVRGADIVGTPLASFSKILATSDRREIFNGFCGAESGNVPVAAVSPAILVSEMEVQRTEKSADRPPLLPPPTGGAR